MTIQTYLFFDGKCDEALAFYKKAIGAEVDMLMRFKDNPEPQGNPPNMLPDKVMHAQFTVGDTVVMASDGQCQGKPSFQGFALALHAKDETDAKRLFGALSDGGEVRMPLAKTFFSPSFGMLTDRFGVSWMVIVLAAKSARAAA